MDSEENYTPMSLEHDFIPIKMRYKRNRIMSPSSTSSKSGVSCCVIDDIPVDLGIIDDPGDGLEPLDLKKKKMTKRKGKKTFQKKTDFGSQQEVTGDESEEDDQINKEQNQEEKSSCKMSMDLGVPLPEE